MCCCLLTCSFRLLPPICLPFSPAGCCVTSLCAHSALGHLLSFCRLSSMRRLVVALPLVVPPLPCVSSPHSIVFCNAPADYHVASHLLPSCMLICIQGIPVCKQGFKYAYGNPHLQTWRSGCCISVCKWGLPYAYRDSFLKVGDHCMHLVILICIRG